MLSFSFHVLFYFVKLIVCCGDNPAQTNCFCLRFLQFTPSSVAASNHRHYCTSIFSHYTPPALMPQDNKRY
uniref:Putative secreted peptide n=1 Tax=Anopheles braziliensis TaxID=58242 RepID=A0A2M3ZRL7_9DIPT